jgi:hypothetical protein
MPSWLRRHEPPPVPTAQELAATMDLNSVSGPAPATDHLIVLAVLLRLRQPREDILPVAAACGLNDDTVSQLIKGDIELRLNLASDAHICEAWVKDSALVGPARDIFDRVRTRKPVLPQSRADSDAALPETPGAAAGQKGGPGGGPDPSTAQTPADLVALLRTYRIWQGKPPYRLMAERINHQYASSTLSTADKGKLVGMHLFLAYLKGCEADDEELVAWRTAWQNMTMKGMDTR